MAFTWLTGFTVDGNVGIGEVSPQQKLHIKGGGVRVEKAATGLGGFINVGNSTEIAGNYSGYLFGNTALDTSYFKGGIVYETVSGTNGRGDMHFLQNNAASAANATLSDSKMTILNASGNVGIGNSNPTGYKLDVTGTGRFTSDLTVDNNLTVSGGNISLGSTGRIQGVDTVSSGTDAANKNYVDDQFNTDEIGGSFKPIVFFDFNSDMTCLIPSL